MRCLFSFDKHCSYYQLFIITNTKQLRQNIRYTKNSQHFDQSITLLLETQSTQYSNAFYYSNVLLRSNDGLRNFERRRHWDYRNNETRRIYQSQTNRQFVPVSRPNTYISDVHIKVTREEVVFLADVHVCRPIAVAVSE
eukprot:Lankesteria_metandrocarpae@DN4013_c1_g1_i1.p1